MKLTKVQRQLRTVEIAKSIDAVRAECAFIHERLISNPHVRLQDLYTERGIDGHTFDAVCHALSAAGVLLWPTQLAKKGQALPLIGLPSVDL